MNPFPPALQQEVKEFVGRWAPPGKQVEFGREVIGLLLAFTMSAIDWTREELTAQIVFSGSEPTPAGPVQVVDDD